jgi:hypothetical protein
MSEFMLPQQIERLFDEPPAQYNEEHFRLFREFKDAVNRGEVRAAEPDAASPTGWRVNAWVKKGILHSYCARRLKHPRWLVHRARRRVHAADVR